MTTPAPLPAPTAPPRGTPAILRTFLPGEASAESLSADAAVVDARLILRAPEPGSVAGVPFSADAYRDVVVDAVVSLEHGSPDDAYGVFVRQVAERSYLAFLVTPDGRGSLVMVADGASSPIAEGRLPADAPFAPGLAAPNRLTVVTAGPCVTCLVNGFVMTGVTLDARFKAGLAGVLLLHLSSAAGESAVALHWAQIRALLADQD